MNSPRNGEGRPATGDHSHNIEEQQTPAAYGSVIPSATNRGQRRAHLRTFAVAVIMAEAAFELDQHGGDLDAALAEARSRIAADFAAAQTAADEALRLVAEVER